MERQGMGIGPELARLLLEQSTDEQARRMPDSARIVEGDEVQPAGTNRPPSRPRRGR